jgi:hypothetical protein
VTVRRVTLLLGTLGPECGSEHYTPTRESARKGLLGSSADPTLENVGLRAMNVQVSRLDTVSRADVMMFSKVACS